MAQAMGTRLASVSLRSSSSSIEQETVPGTTQSAIQKLAEEECVPVLALLQARETMAYLAQQPEGSALHISPEQYVQFLAHQEEYGAK